jgi:hypothetical protein
MMVSANPPDGYRSYYLVVSCIPILVTNCYQYRIKDIIDIPLICYTGYQILLKRRKLLDLNKMSLTRSVVLSFIASYAAIPMEIDSQNPTYVGQIPVPFPAFATIADSAFYISSFDANPFGGKDYEYIIRDASSLMSTKTKANILVEKMNGNVVWPNVASKAPSFFGAKGVVIPGGFLTPGRQSGGLWFGKEDGTIIELFRSPDYFYHAVAFYDVNQDGKMDILTCRSNKGYFNTNLGCLVPVKVI